MDRIEGIVLAVTERGRGERAGGDDRETKGLGRS